MLLLLSSFTLLRVANTSAAATVGMPPPLPPPPPLSDDACYTDSSPATSAQAVCRGLESRASLNRPLPAGCAGGKGGDDDGGTDIGGRSRITHRIGMVLPSPTRGDAMAARVAGKYRQRRQRGRLRRQRGWRAMTMAMAMVARAMAMATRVQGER
jgi:hypothetical protein